MTKNEIASLSTESLKTILATTKPANEKFCMPGRRRAWVKAELHRREQVA